MLLAIAILAGLDVILRTGKNLMDGNFDIPAPGTVILILSTWDMCFPIAIITLMLGAICVVIEFSK